MKNELLTSAHILVVDDEPINALLLKRTLESAGYTRIDTTTDPLAVLPLCQQQVPDLILLDVMMPQCDGFTVIEQLRPILASETYLPILVLTADAMPDTKRRALAVGAKDFLTKPFDYSEVLLRVRNLLETRWLYRQIQNQNQILEERVQERTLALQTSNTELQVAYSLLEQSQAEVLLRLAQAAELRDDDTGQHTQRVARLATALAQHMQLPPEQVELIRRASPLHDVGKIGVPDAVLLKPGPLTDEEFAVIKTHTTIGAALLADGQSPLMHMAHDIAISHHERWDGQGYPYGLSREEIPLEGRILAVVDVFDALTNQRPYKNAWTPEDALEEIKRCRGTQFDPHAVDAFVKLPILQHHPP